MNKILSTLIALSVCAMTHAQVPLFQNANGLDSQTNISGDVIGLGASDIQVIYPVTDLNFEWSQFKSKTGSALILKDALTLESKKEGQQIFSVVELPVDPENDMLLFGASFIGPKLDDSTKVGIIFDYSDSRNFKGIAINKNQYFYFIAKDGVISDVRTGLIKYKGKVYSLMMTKEGDKVTLMLNGIEFAKINKVQITEPYFGLFFEGKGKTVIPSFYFAKQNETESEQTN